VAQKSKLLTQYNSLLFFQPPCIILAHSHPVQYIIACVLKASAYLICVVFTF